MERRVLGAAGRAILAAASLVAAFAAWRDAAIAYYAAEPSQVAPAMIAREPRVRLAQWADANSGALPYDGKSSEEVKAAAAAALKQDPLSARALSSLALAGLYDAPDGAEHIMRLAERVSRRDAPSQIWLAQLSGERGDFAGLARRVDHINRVRPAIGIAVIPALLPLLDQPGFREGVLAHADQAWPLELVRQSAVRGQSLQASQALFTRLSNRHLEPYRAARAALLAALLKNEDVAGVRALAGAALTLDRFAPSPASLERGLGPFAWALDTPPRAEVALAGPGAVTVSLEGGQNSALMQRITLLAPGEYDLRFRIVADPEAALPNLRWLMLCGAQGNSLLRWQQSVPPISGKLFVAGVTIPAGCTLQRWRLQAVAPDGQRPAEFALHDVSLHRATR